MRTPFTYLPFGLRSGLLRRRRGAVSVETGLLLAIFIPLIGGGVEVAHAVWEYNAAQNAARFGLRIAATSNPVARQLGEMTGLSGDVRAGDVMPDYEIICRGSSQSCSEGQFDAVSFQRILYGPDLDQICSGKSAPRRGMCDIYTQIRPENLTISYAASGFETAGNPADLRPVVTVELTQLHYHFVFLSWITGRSALRLPTIRVAAVSEDLKTGGPE